MEANFVDWWAYFARAPQASFHAGLELSWLHSGIPRAEYNGVVRTQLRLDRSADEVGDVIATTVRSCAIPHVGMSWYITPTIQPASLGDFLQACGFISPAPWPVWQSL